MSQPFLISVRAIEDIIHIQKPGENPRLSNLGEVEEVVYSVNSLSSNCTFADENDSSSLQEFKAIVPKSDSENSKISQRIVKTGSEGDYYSFRNSAESLRLTGEADSEAELRSWPSDSDITVLRMRKEFRNELSAKVEWEEERHLTDASSHNFDWESHSLINLADVLKEKDQAEGLTPFTIWTKGNQTSEAVADISKITNDPMEENLTTEKLSYPCQESLAAQIDAKKEQKVLDPGGIAADQIKPENIVTEMSRPDETTDQSADVNVSRPSKSKLIRDFFRSILLCSSKKNSFDETNSY